MHKLVIWQLREYRSIAAKLMLGWLAVATIAALGTHLLLGATGERAVHVLRLLQFGVIGGCAVIQHIYYFDGSRHGLPFSAANWMLHVPLPQWRTLAAKSIALLPVFVLYLVADGVLTHITGDSGPIGLLNWERVLLILGFFFFCMALVLNTLLMRTIAKARTGLVVAGASAWHRHLRRALSLVIDGVCFAVNWSVWTLMIVTSEVFDARVALLAAPYVQGAILFVLAAALTGLNGYLLDHVTTQIEI